jgi:ADP-ribosylglycohydrolase
MRTAALGLFFLRAPGRLPTAVADISRITHQDPRSVAGGIAIAKAAQLLATGEPPEAPGFCSEIASAMRPYEAAFSNLVEELPVRLEQDRESALYAIAWAGSPRPEFSRPVITPFVVPTVLAALWAVLRNSNSWTGAVAEAIGLGGDVDTLGAIVGALMGARLGATAIPARLASGVLGSERIKVLASQYYEAATARRVIPES